MSRRHRRHEHSNEKSRKDRRKIARRIRHANGHIPDHRAASGRHRRGSLHPHRAAARKRARDDLARQAVCPRDQALLPQDWSLSDFGGRFDQAEIRLVALHAPGLQRSDEQGGRRLEIYLRWTVGPACRQSEAAADLPDAWREWRATRYSSGRQSSADNQFRSLGIWTSAYAARPARPAERGRQSGRSEYRATRFWDADRVRY